MMKPCVELFLNQEINQIKIIEEKKMFVELKKNNNFLFYEDFFQENDYDKFQYEKYETKSQIIYENFSLFTISPNYFNKWNLKNFKDIEIMEHLEIQNNEILDTTLNFNKEMVIVLSKEKNLKSLKLNGIYLKNLQGNNVLKLKKKQSEIKNFTFFESELKQTINLSSFIVNRDEKKKFEEMDIIFEVILFFSQ